MIPSMPNRERKRLLAYVSSRTPHSLRYRQNESTKIHVRVQRWQKPKTLAALNPKSSAQQIQTPSEIVELVDTLLDHHIYSREIADILNKRGLPSRQIGSA